MFSSCRAAAVLASLLLSSGLLTGCEVTSVELHSPGIPDDSTVLKADLTAETLEAPDRLNLDALLQMRVGVGNGGNLTAGPGWIVRVVLSTDPQIDGSDRQIDQFVTSRELAPGAQDLYLRNKKLSGLGPGDYFIGSIVDVTQIVPELSEANNALASPSLITLLPEAAAP